MRKDAMTNTKDSGQQGSLPNNDKLNEIAKRYAADDRLWTTQETVETNLIRAMQEWGDIKSDSDNDCLIQGNLMLRQQLQQAEADVARLDRTCSYIRFQADAWSNTGDTKSLRDSMKSFVEAIDAAMKGKRNEQRQTSKRQVARSFYERTG